MTERKFLTIKEIVDCNEYPFTMGQMRLYLSLRQQNGLVEACIKIGKRVLINKDKFDKWLEKQYEKKK